MRRRLAVVLLLLIALSARPARASQQLIVRTNIGATAIQTVCHLLGCTLLHGLDDPQSQLFLISITGSLGPLQLAILTSGLGALHIEVDLPIALPNQLTRGAAPDGLFDRALVPFAGAPVWNGYAYQPAAVPVHLEEARLSFGVQGSAIVGVIDTGVDPNHPALRNVLVPGYDFTRDLPGDGSEMGDVSQSTTAVVDGGAPAAVNSSTVAVLDQSTTAVVDGQGHQAFGHGTMVAGIIHLVAPEARIMPLKAFGANGQGYTSDVIRAIYWASSSGARVLNMSFNFLSYSSELETALTHAVSRGAICVAAAGNDGQRIAVYPASLSNIMGVASTGLTNQRSSFSNYGSQVVWVAAPGEGIITTYPYATYAAGWGTSFSTPFVSGTAALLLQANSSLDESGAASAIANATPVGDDLGNGLLDVYRALASIVH